MTTSIFDKTDKGREEIATRRYHLAPRMRTLLLLIDGKHTNHELLQKLRGMGLTEESLAELLNDGYIHAVAAPPVVQSVAPATRVVKIAEAPAGARLMPDGKTQFEAVYQFYTETIKSMIGLRGYGLQMKVEKAGAIEELRELRKPYLEAVLKAKGNELARGLSLRLDELLYYGEEVPDHTTIADLNSVPLDR
jgi:hypothetical protein